MLIFKTTFRCYSANFSDKLIKLINTSNFKYCNLAAKKSRNSKRLQTLDTIKLFNKLFSDCKYNNVKYINNGKNIINIKSIPAPKLIQSIKIFKYKHTIDEGIVLDDVNKSLLIRSLFGNRIESKDIKKSLIIKRITEIYPIELKNIMFNFATKYVDKMDDSELSNFNELLDTYSNDTDSKLYNYILAKGATPTELLNHNIVFIKLLKFVSTSHPFIKNG